jgi:hypothetical protein
LPFGDAVFEGPSSCRGLASLQETEEPFRQWTYGFLKVLPRVYLAIDVRRPNAYDVPAVASYIKTASKCAGAIPNWLFAVEVVVPSHACECGQSINRPTTTLVAKVSPAALPLLAIKIEDK